MFLLGASKNIGAKPLADAAEAVIEVIRAIMKREHLIADPHSLRFPPCVGASERAGCREALVAAARAVYDCFDKLNLDARRAVASLSNYVMRKSASGACSSTLDLVPSAETTTHAQSRPWTDARDFDVIVVSNVHSA